MHSLLRKNFDFKINVIPNGLEKHKSFSLNNKLFFIDSFQFLSFSSDSLARNSVKNECKHFSQKFDSEVLDLVKQKGFYPYEYMCDFENFYETLPDKNEFYSSLIGKRINNKKYQQVLKVWNKFQMKTMK